MPRWIIVAFNVVVGSKTMCGLEPLRTTVADGRRLDAVKQQGLRRALGAAPAHLDRAAANQLLFEPAERAAARLPFSCLSAENEDEH